MHLEKETKKLTKRYPQKLTKLIAGFQHTRPFRILFRYCKAHLKNSISGYDKKSHNLRLTLIYINFYTLFDFILRKYFEKLLWKIKTF